MTDKTAAPAWIGPAPNLTQATAVMTVGVMGVMIAGLQPLLLGALAQEGRLSAAQIGHAATAELLTMGLAAGLAGAWLKAERLKLIALVSGLVLAVLNVLTVQTTGEMVTLVSGRDDADGTLARACADWLEEHHPAVDVVVYDGGQPRYPLLMSAE